MSSLVAESLAGLGSAQANALDNMSATYGLTPVIAKTANATLVATDSQSVFTNTGACESATAGDWIQLVAIATGVWGRFGVKGTWDAG